MSQHDDFRLRVLIIHRNFESIYPLSCMLSDEAHNVQILAAEHLDEATRKIASALFHLILVDVNIDRRGIFHVSPAGRDCRRRPRVFATHLHISHTVFCIQLDPHSGLTSRESRR